MNEASVDAQWKELVDFGESSRVYSWKKDTVVKVYNEGAPISPEPPRFDTIIRTAFWECLINTYLTKERLPVPRTNGLITAPARFSDDIYLGLILERGLEPVCTPALEQAYFSARRRIQRRGIHVDDSTLIAEIPTGPGRRECFVHNVLQDAAGKPLLIDYGEWKVEPELIPTLAKVYDKVAAPERIRKPSFAEVLHGRVRG